MPLLNQLNGDFDKSSTDVSDQIDINSAAEAALVTRNTMRHLIHQNFLTEIRGENRGIFVMADELHMFMQRYESASALSRRLGLSLQDTIVQLKLLDLRPINHLHYSGSSIFEREATGNILNDHFVASPVNEKQRYDLSKLEVFTTTSRIGYCTVSAAAKKLKVNYENIYNYIQSGILFPYRSSATGRIVLKNTDIDRVAATYLLPTQCRKILKLDYRLCSRHLIEMGVNPVTYKQVKGCTQPLFLRSDIEKLAKNLNELPSGLITSHEASMRLNLSHPTVLRLIALGDLAPECNTTKLRCASLDKVVNFKNTHVNGVEAAEITNINVKLIRQILSKFGVQPICIPQKDYSSCLIYRLNELCEYGVRIPSTGRNGSTKWSHLNIVELLSVETAAADLDIPVRSFWSVFLRSKFIPTIRINQKLHITPSDAAKCREILAHSMTPAMVDQKLSVPRIAVYLRRIGVLETSTNIPADLPQGTFITRASFDRLSETAYPRKVPIKQDV
ncbi:hypothetical protein [Pseudomonas sp. Pseu.R1]|uniref:hypothetical protein n=1 Tax=Pseudomonas sp. Pseu.R1 TaxID=3379818 RepID=UPI003B94040B